MTAEVTYKETDGIFYPELMIPDETKDLRQLGKFGIMAMNYLKENEKERYKSLLRFGRLAEKMKEVEEEANRMMDLLQTQYLSENKPKDPASTMEMWKIRQQARILAEEIVLKEIVLKYH